MYTQVPYKYHGTSKDILTGFSRTLPVPLWTEAAKSIILSSFSFYRVVYIYRYTHRKQVPGTDAGNITR